MIIKQIFNIHWCFFYDQSEVEKKNDPRISSSKDNRHFSTDLLQIGNGVNDFITLNNLYVLVKSVEELTEKIYPDISNISTKTLNWFQERAILTPNNEQIDEIKTLLFQNLKLHRLTQTWIERRQYITQLNS